MNRRDEVYRAISDTASRINNATWWDDSEYVGSNGKTLMDRLLDQLDRIYGVLPDDGEQIDLNWIRKVCNHEDYGVAPGCFCILSDGQVVRIKKDAIRGRFRRLCEALGVELKEVKGE